jgi:hypothetical protein
VQLIKTQNAKSAAQKIICRAIPLLTSPLAGGNFQEADSQPDRLGHRFGLNHDPDKLNPVAATETTRPSSGRFVGF